jgi:hypothetical protein
VLIILTFSSIKLQSPIIIGPIRAIITAVGCITVFAPIVISPSSVVCSEQTIAPELIFTLNNLFVIISMTYQSIDTNLSLFIDICFESKKSLFLD